jgi:hypothetical protein
MRKLVRTIAATLALTAALGFVPSRANAVGYEDSLDDCAYPQIFDALVMRPLGFATMLGGAAVLVPLMPLTLWPATVNRDSGTFVYEMVVPAAKFTFARRLGECSATSTAY